MSYQNCYGVKFVVGDTVEYQSARGGKETGTVAKVKNEGFNGWRVSFTSGASCTAQDVIRSLPSPDYGYLQHGAGTQGPYRTERVSIKNEYADKWLAFFEGKWRRVHIQLRRTFIVFQGEKITIQIEGV